MSGCLDPRIPTDNCPPCPIKDAGFCDEMREVMGKIRADLARKWQNISEKDREEILANTFNAVCQNPENFERRRGAKFSTWVWSIYNRKRMNYLRWMYRQDRLFKEIAKRENEFTKTSEVVIEDEEPEVVVNLSRSLSNDTTGCVSCYLDLYSIFNEGLQQKHLAMAYAIRPNTLTQQLKRCRRILRDILKKVMGW